MAKRKDGATYKPDKFHIGQLVRFCTEGDAGGWDRANGEIGEIVRGRCWIVGDIVTVDGKFTGEKDDGSFCYLVRWRGGEINMEEDELRPIDDGSDSVSSWDRFEKATGIDIITLAEAVEARYASR